ncbi:MAG TPA: hypothetical protein VNT30_16690 [Stellaceae bacterium]|nr:hypothetical protein [Stellaceae bacterium]
MVDLAIPTPPDTAAPPVIMRIQIMSNSGLTISEKPNKTVSNLMKFSLEEDGFTRKIPDVFVKDIDKKWRGWIVLENGPSSFSPRVGIINFEINDALYHVAKQVYTEPYNNIKKSIIGPATVMASLSELIGDPVEVYKVASWCHLKDHPPEKVADDLVARIRDQGYEFIQSNLTLEALAESALRYNVFIHAQRYSTPALLMRLGKTDSLNRFIQECVRFQRPEVQSPEYQKYAGLYQLYITKMAEYLNFDADKIEW